MKSRRVLLVTYELLKQLVTDPERLKDPIDFIQRLLDEKDKNDKIITAFKNDKIFQNALNSSFEYFIPEFISLFMDDKIRKGLKLLKLLISTFFSVQQHFIKTQQQIVPQPRLRQPSGFNDIQSVQQHIMFKQL